MIHWNKNNKNNNNDNSEVQGTRAVAIIGVVPDRSCVHTDCIPLAVPEGAETEHRQLLAARAADYRLLIHNNCQSR